MRVLRVYHGGRSSDQRAREHALSARGIEVTLVVPTTWPEPGGIGRPSRDSDIEVIELEVIRPEM